jgi:16S rRNA (uracil1498-N3)-methyltransferase
MSLHRFYLSPERCQGPELVLTETEAHHASAVLRLRCGDRALILDGAGCEYSASVKQLERDRVTLAVVDKRCVPAPAHQVTLLQAVPKGKLIESIIEKATELGAARVVPLLTERAVVHLDAGAAPKKALKWQSAAVEAIKQCGSAWLTQVEAPVTPAEFLARHEPFDLALAGSLQPDARHPRQCFREFQDQQGRLPNSVAIWIGPEGDFSPPELQSIQGSGAKPITLGRQVLRTETAAIYCLSIVNYELS